MTQHAQQHPVHRHADYYAYSADYWYRHADDPDQRQRELCQMSAGAACEQNVHKEVASLRAGGYTVQKVVLLTTCPDCQGAGRIGKVPKGTRKAKVANLPYWRLTWVSCQRCAGVGATESREILL